MKKVILFLITIYQKTLGHWKGETCVFYPSCSEYSKEVFVKYGIIKGCYLSLRRIIRCHPWQISQVDNP